MKPDKFDIKIREAAAQSESLPANPDLAWSSMAKLLDKEMPRRKGRKRFLWFLLLFPLALGIYLVKNQFSGEINEEKGIKKEITVNTPPTSGVTKNSEPHKKVLIKLPVETSDGITSAGSDPSKKLPAAKEKTHRNYFIHENKIFTGPTFRRFASNGQNKNSNIESLSSTIIENNNDSPPQNTLAFKIEDSLVSAQGKSTKVSLPKPVINVAEKSDNGIKRSEKKNRPGENKKSFSRDFAVTISAGTDVSAVSLRQIGSVKSIYGGGFSYRFTNHFSLRTGFYISKKQYRANAGEYHPPAGFWNVYPNLESVEADCKVYEVPLSINYNFSNSKKHSWFASAGMSSYFMKKEDYEYYSKPYGTSYGEHSERNKNKHYFSLLRFSGGYEKQINSKMSFSIEPYITIPAKGVGYGKVKLYSSGILFSISIKPFLKK